MSPHVPHALDSIVAMIVPAMVATTTVLLTEPAPGSVEAVQEMRLLLLPLLGATLFSFIMVLLNPKPETRRITIGRAVAALVFGVMAPQILAMFHPALAAISLKPVMLVLIGGLTASLLWVLSRPFVAQMYERAEGIAAREAERLESLYSPAVAPQDKGADKQGS